MSDVPAEVAAKLTNAVVRLIVEMTGDPADRDGIVRARDDLRGAIQEAVSNILDEARKPALVPVTTEVWGVYDLNRSSWWPRSFPSHGEALEHLNRCKGPGTRAEVKERL
jgi:hypothetical protein